MKTIVLKKYGNCKVQWGIDDLPRARKSKEDNSEAKQLARYHTSAVVSEQEVVVAGQLPLVLSPLNRKHTIIRPDEIDTYRIAQTRALDFFSDFQRTLKEKRQRSKDYKKPNRPTQFGSKAKQRIMEGCFVGQRKYGTQSPPYFVTLTLPGDTRSSTSALARYAGFVCNRLLQYVRRSGVCHDWLYVWELQKRGALHLHLVLFGEDSERIYALGKKLCKVWFDILKDVGERDGTCLFSHRSGKFCWMPQKWQADIRSVAEGNIGAYLGKYLGKQAHSTRDGKGGFSRDGASFPPRWWGMSRSLLHSCNLERLEVRLIGVPEADCCEAIERIQSFVETYQPVIRTHYAYDIQCQVDGHSRKVGSTSRWSAYLKEAAFMDIQVWLNQLIRFLCRVTPHLSVEWRYNSRPASLPSLQDWPIINICDGRTPSHAA